MPFEFSIRRRVEFVETDMAGIMHFSNFFRFMETAEASFYRSLGFSVVMIDSGIGWPRVHAECDYARPLMFEEEVEVRLLVAERRKRSATYLFKFIKQENGQSVVAARGKFVVVCATKGPDGRLAACALPELYNQKVEVAPAEVLAAW
jgi:YbgC/YbaW family acyl-CoA thioester hydrolase